MERRMDGDRADGCEPAPSPEERMARQRRLVRRARRRALTDLTLLPAAVLLAALPANGAHQALLYALFAASAGILLFLVRRWRDLGALARADRWRAEAVEGRGLSISAWRAGDPLAGWAERRGDG